ncbi:hypothetical protein E3U43_001133 [Larimichthys crocea]|uniref:Uncharacterized protein n=1 Tax=Larimichthys crocea TaxID=215358 RepID=A0ACD3RD43_LARCR|nr:hypothetical protein E3U43_001133 [Larimichthys crocea]
MKRNHTRLELTVPLLWEHRKRSKKQPSNEKEKEKTNIRSQFEKKRVRKPVLSSDAKTKMVHDQQDKQLQQMPVVKLERSGPLPVRVTLKGHGSHYLEVKSAVFSSSSVRCQHNKNKQVFSGLKMYPIRSRFREAHMDSSPFLEEPLGHKKTTFNPSSQVTCPKIMSVCVTVKIQHHRFSRSLQMNNTRDMKKNGLFRHN